MSLRLRRLGRPAEKVAPGNTAALFVFVFHCHFPPWLSIGLIVHSRPGASGIAASEPIGSPRSLALRRARLMQTGQICSS